MGYYNNVIVNLVVSGLIIAGGLGFVVWVDLRMAWQHYKDNFKVFKLRKFITSLSLHTKIVFLITIFLLISGTLIILGLEFDNMKTLGTMPWPEKILASFFHQQL